MSKRKSDKPTADDLAGVPVCIEETMASRRRRRSSPPVGVRGAHSQPPTADDIAGTPVSATGKEDVTKKPRRR